MTAAACCCESFWRRLGLAEVEPSSYSQTRTAPSAALRQSSCVEVAGCMSASIARRPTC